MPLILPSPSDRLTIVGRTGSGKTFMGAHVLSRSPWDKMPYIVVDYKGDKLLNDIPFIREHGIKDRLPKHAGLYIVHPRVDTDDELMNTMLQRALDQERVGLVFDEGYMIPDKAALRGLYTQGRSKQIPMITLSQRPSLMTRFAFTEASMLSTYAVTDREDNKRLKEYIPDFDINEKMPKYHSRWYDVNQNQLFKLSPVPDRDTILNTFYDRAAPRRRII